MPKIDEQKINIILSRSVEEVIKHDHLKEVLQSGKALRVKFGIDPTAPDLHLGHAVILRKLRQFQDIGHKVVLIIGDFTAQIGDPSGRTKTRKSLSKQNVAVNMKKYLQQAGKVIDIKKTEVRYNSEWLKKSLEDLLELTRSASIQQILRRSDFKRRLKQDEDITLLELLYPIMQGYDSVVIKADVELGGTDQKFNLLMGRRVQRHFNVPEQDIITLPLIEGTDGEKKMSKSYGNYIGITESPDDMFGKLMSIPDRLIAKYFETLTDIDVPHGSPRDQKLLLAQTIVETYHSAKAGEKARSQFIETFSRGGVPHDAPTLSVPKEIGIVNLLVKAGISSKSEARRLIEQRAVKINNETHTDTNETLSLNDGDVLKIGKHRFFKIKIK